MKKRKFDEDDEEGGGDEWLLTYGDLMTQLVCFFVLIVAFSSLNVQKFQEVLASIQIALGGGAASGVLTELPSAVDIPLHSSELKIEEGKLMELKGKVDEYIEKQKLSEYLETRITHEGLQITLKQQEPSVFFDTAEARIKDEAFPILNQIGKFLKDITNEVRIEGHTDIRPIHTAQFPSNWELSVTRATNVLKYLSENCGISANRLSAAGYGPYKPIAPNDTEVGMSKNRRVEIIILRKSLKEESKPESKPIDQLISNNIK
ncbi:TPA: flagellar motor protein MotB [Candidatus Poribacteria bacterium]|nr:flagellar motor protein MotB [Candidatus Poribacteria bacterium]